MLTNVLLAIFLVYILLSTTIGFILFLENEFDYKNENKKLVAVVVSGPIWWILLPFKSFLVWFINWLKEGEEEEIS
jgi:hypothetical protein